MISSVMSASTLALPDHARDRPFGVWHAAFGPGISEQLHRGRPPFCQRVQLAGLGGAESVAAHSGDCLRGCETQLRGVEVGDNAVRAQPGQAQRKRSSRGQPDAQVGLAITKQPIHGGVDGGHARDDVVIVEHQCHRMVLKGDPSDEPIRQVIGVGLSAHAPAGDVVWRVAGRDQQVLAKRGGVAIAFVQRVPHHAWAGRDPLGHEMALAIAGIGHGDHDRAPARG